MTAGFRRVVLFLRSTFFFFNAFGLQSFPCNCWVGPNMGDCKDSIVNACKIEMTGHMAPSLIPVFQLFCSLQKTFQALEKSSPFHNVPCRSPSPDRSIYRYASQYCLPPLACCIIVVCSINDSMPLKLSVVIIHCAINCFGKLYEVSGYNTGK